jgi:hypothetical protein
MASRLAVAVVSAFAISLLVVGGGGAAVCDPHCSPDKSNKGGELRGQDRANWVHEYKNGGGTGGDPGGTPLPVVIPPSLPPPDADGDGIPDAQDLCPNEYGLTASGCPPLTGG